MDDIVALLTSFQHVIFSKMYDTNMNFWRQSYKVWPGPPARRKGRRRVWWPRWHRLWWRRATSILTNLSRPDDHKDDNTDGRNNDNTDDRNDDNTDGRNDANTDDRNDANTDDW